MQVLISCPNCNTSYRIDEKQLLDSDGQARCYHCETIFNAAMNSQPISDNGSAEQNLNLPTSADLYDSILDGDALDDDLSSLFSNDEHSAIINGPEDIEPANSSILMPEDLLDIEADNAPPLKPLTREYHQPTAKAPGAFGTLAWAAGSLLLLTLFITQSAWHYRDTLLLNPQMRSVFEVACGVLNCKLPDRRDPHAYQIVERKVTVHPEVKGILSISLLYKNTADFAQQPPGIILSLFDRKQELIARRSFEYKNYSGDFSGDMPIYNAGHTQSVQLNLEDPGPDVTGFEFSFY